MSRCLHSEDFTAYCDEFGSPQDTERRTMGVAGLLAPFSKWGEFSSHWESYLTLEKVPQPFHMKDFVHHSKAFSDARWEKWEERERILTGLVSILHDVHAIPVAASVVLSDYNALTPDQKGRCKSPYHLAFQAVTSNMGFAAASIDLEAKLAKALEAYRQNVELDEKSLAKLTSVSMVYAKLEGYTGSADELWSAIKATNMFGAWMSSYNVKEPKNCPPLQAADIWAYCIGRFGERDRPVVREDEMALSFFFAESQTTKHAAHFFTLLDHGAITARVG
jgi:hypothetical protein